MLGSTFCQIVSTSLHQFNNEMYVTIELFKKLTCTLYSYVVLNQLMMFSCYLSVFVGFCLGIFLVKYVLYIGTLTLNDNIEIITCFA
jgi:hypothetical protein